MATSVRISRVSARLSIKNASLIFIPLSRPTSTFSAKNTILRFCTPSTNSSKQFRTSSNSCTPNECKVYNLKYVNRLYATGNFQTYSKHSCVDKCFSSRTQHFSFVRYSATFNASSTSDSIAEAVPVEDEEYYALNDTEEFAADDEDLHDLDLKHRKDAKLEHLSQDVTNFATFPIDVALKEKLVDLGYQKPFDVQVQSLTHLLNGKDVIVQAKTGSGKTLAFAIPIIHHVKKSRRVPLSPRALVIAPTRELCNQIHRCVQELDSSVRCVPVYGGASIRVQEGQIRRGVDVVCATPGRLHDLIRRGVLRLDKLSLVCLDEADALLNPNFKEDIEDILFKSPRSKQVMLFSATMPRDVLALSRNYMADPVHVKVVSESGNNSPSSVQHKSMKVPLRHHLSLAITLLRLHQPERCIVFRTMKVQVANTVRQLRHKMDWAVEGLHSDLSQAKRESVLRDFRLGKTRVLVATDIAARGLDIPEIDMVLQLEPPRSGLDYYIHRAGRTGRAGRPGLSVILYDANDMDTEIIAQLSKQVNLENVQTPRISSEDFVREEIPDAIKNFGRTDAQRERRRNSFGQKRKGKYETLIY